MDRTSFIELRLDRRWLCWLLCYPVLHAKRSYNPKRAALFAKRVQHCHFCYSYVRSPPQWDLPSLKWTHAIRRHKSEMAEADGPNLCPKGGLANFSILTRDSRCIPNLTSYPALAAPTCTTSHGSHHSVPGWCLGCRVCRLRLHPSINWVPSVQIARRSFRTHCQTATDLNLVQARIEKDITRFPPSESDQEILKLYQECKRIGAALASMVQSLTARGTSKLTYSKSSLAVTARGVWKDGQIEALKESLEQVRSRMMLAIMISVWYNLLPYSD